MDSFYPSRPDQDYVITPDGSVQGTAPSSNMNSATPIGLNQSALDREYYDASDENTIDAYQWNSRYNAHTTSASTQVQSARREYGCCSGRGMYLSGRPVPVLDNCDISFDNLHRVASPYSAHAINELRSRDQWTPNENFNAQLSSTHSTPMVFQADPVMMQGMPLTGMAVPPVTSHLPSLHYPGNAAFAEQEQEQVQNARTAMPEMNDVVARIGSVLSNGKFVCDVEGCGSQTFARQAELRRHHTTLHAANKPNFWCQVSTCRRSIVGGGEAFHRKDKLVAHVRSMHPDVQQVCS